MVISAVVCTSLIIGADIDTGSNEGLDAFAASLAAGASAGATAAQARAGIRGGGGGDVRRRGAVLASSGLGPLSRRLPQCCQALRGSATTGRALLHAT